MKLQIENFSNLDDKEFRRKVSIVFDRVIHILNLGILFSDNFDATTVDNVTFTTAGVDVAVPHNLGRTPVGYMIQSQSTSAVIYAGASQNTDKNLFLRSTGANVARVMVY